MYHAAASQASEYGTINYTGGDIALSEVGGGAQATYSTMSGGASYLGASPDVGGGQRERVQAYGTIASMGGGGAYAGGGITASEFGGQPRRVQSSYIDASFVNEHEQMTTPYSAMPTPASAGYDSLHGNLSTQYTDIAVGEGGASYDEIVSM